MLHATDRSAGSSQADRPSTSPEEMSMARKRRHTKSARVRAHRAKFGAASRHCFKTSAGTSWKAFGSCMRSELKGRKRRR